MTWLVDALRENPELALFLVLALGAAIGQVRLGSFQPGPVLGSLIAGLVVGQLGIAPPAGLKDVFFLLFLFAVGLRTGAEFFRCLRASAIPQLFLSITLVATGLALAWTVAGMLDLDPGTGAGLAECVQLAHLVARRLAKDGLKTTVPVTSGSKGMQLYAPLPRRRPAVEVRQYARDLAHELAREHPQLVVAVMRKDLRGGKVLLDWSQSDVDLAKMAEITSPLGPRDQWTKPTVLLGSAGLLLAGPWELIGSYG